MRYTVYTVNTVLCASKRVCAACKETVEEQLLRLYTLFPCAQLHFEAALSSIVFSQCMCVQSRIDHTLSSAYQGVRAN